MAVTSLFTDMTGNALFHSFKVSLRKELKLEGWRQQRATRRTSLARLSSLEGPLLDRRAKGPRLTTEKLGSGRFQPFWCDFFQTVSRAHQEIMCSVDS